MRVRVDRVGAQAGCDTAWTQRAQHTALRKGSVAVKMRGSSRTASSMRQAPVADLSLPPAEPALAKLLTPCPGEIADGKHQEEACTARG